MNKSWIPEQPKDKTTKELLNMILTSLDEESGFIGDLTFANAIFVDDWLTKRGFDSQIENETDNFGGDLQRPNHKCVYFKKHNCCQKGKQ